MTQAKRCPNYTNSGSSPTWKPRDGHDEGLLLDARRLCRRRRWRKHLRGEGRRDLRWTCPPAPERHHAQHGKLQLSAADLGLETVQSASRAMRSYIADEPSSPAAAEVDPIRDSACESAGMRGLITEKIQDWFFDYRQRPQSEVRALADQGLSLC